MSALEIAKDQDAGNMSRPIRRPISMKIHAENLYRASLEFCQALDRDARPDLLRKHAAKVFDLASQIAEEARRP
jgi:ABC-type thiamine transport system ATPase subunit